MKSLNFAIFATIVVLVKSDIYFFDSDQSEGSPCTTVAGFEGSCTPRSNCPSERWSRNRRDICFFRKAEKVVCCREDFNYHKRHHFHSRHDYENDNFNNFNSVYEEDETSDDSMKTKRVSEKKFDEYMEKIFSEKPVTQRPPGRVPTLPGQYPHMSAIGFTLPTEEIDWKCGGNLISEYFVLTAAHCANDNGRTPDVIRIGDLNLTTQEDNVSPQTFRVESAHVHPQYNASLYYHDIGLLELSERARFTEFVRPACLWGHRDIPYEGVVAMGYGSLEFGGIQTKSLTELSLSLLTNEDCNKRLPSIAAAQEGVIDSQICAMDYSGLTDTCQGDSGGPLQLNIPKRGKIYYYIIGITSFGIYCGGKFPSVYTRISSYVDWIEHIVWPY